MGSHVARSPEGGPIARRPAAGRSGKEEQLAPESPGSGRIETLLGDTGCRTAVHVAHLSLCQTGRSVTDAQGESQDQSKRLGLPWLLRFSQAAANHRASPGNETPRPVTWGFSVSESRHHTSDGSPPRTAGSARNGVRDIAPLGELSVRRILASVQLQLRFESYQAHSL